MATWEKDDRPTDIAYHQAFQNERRSNLDLRSAVRRLLDAIKKNATGPRFLSDEVAALAELDRLVPAPKEGP